MAKIKILLVDDEVDFLEMLSTRIKKWGFDVIEARSGKEGMDAIASQRPDIVILDYVMPDMDGISVLREIREKDKDIPVIMYTAYPDKVPIRAAEGLNINAFIPKLSVYEDTQTILKTAIEIAVKKIEKKVDANGEHARKNEI